MKTIHEEKIYCKIIFGDLSFRTVKCYKVITSSDDNYDNIDLYTNKRNKK